MKFLFTLSIILATSFLSAQQTENIKLIYQNTTVEAKNAINEFLKVNPDKNKDFKAKYATNTIFLTDNQFSPIQAYVNTFQPNDSDKSLEFQNFKKKYYERYINVSTIIKE